MLYIKEICLVFFIIINILFTVGYASQPIFESSQVINNPTNVSGTQSNNIFTGSFYVSRISNIITNFQNTYSSTNDYNNINTTLNVFFESLLYSCIVITILLIIGFLFGLFNFKRISKLVFFITTLLMIIVFIVIQAIIILNNLISNIKQNGFSWSGFTSISNSNGSGYYIIFSAVILMTITNTIYLFLA